MKNVLYGPKLKVNEGSKPQHTQVKPEIDEVREGK